MSWKGNKPKRQGRLYSCMRCIWNQCLRVSSSLTVTIQSKGLDRGFLIICTYMYIKLCLQGACHVPRGARLASRVPT